MNNAPKFSDSVQLHDCDSRTIVCAWLIALLLIVGATGCSTFNKKKSADGKSWSPSTWFKKEFQEPTSIAAIWSPDTLTVPGRPTERGFGGRIYFYNERTQAVPVDGDLLVHGYLTTPNKANFDVKADKRFNFSAEQLSGHFSPSEIGASYSIWVPWDEADGYREEVTLILTFKSKNGTVVQGTPAKVFLPGKAPDGVANKDASSRYVQAQSVSYTSKSIPTNAGIDNMRTTTIEIPKEAQQIIRRSTRGFQLGAPNNSTSTGASQQDANASDPSTVPRRGFDLQTFQPAPAYQPAPPSVNIGFHATQASFTKPATSPIAKVRPLAPPPN